MGAGYQAAENFNDLRYRAGDESVEVGSKIAALVFDPNGNDPEFRVPKIMYGRVIAIRMMGTTETATYITQDDEIFTVPYAQTCVAHHELY